MKKNYDRELEKAKQYFDLHPEDTKASRKILGTTSSYYRESDGTITRLATKSEEKHVLGQGGFGRIKAATTEIVERPTAVKIQNVRHCPELIPMILAEADVNVDLGLAKQKAVITHKYDFETQQQEPYKIYQTLYDLGVELKPGLLSLFDDERRLELAIEFLLQVAKLHDGSLSKTHTAYASRDLKAENILLDIYSPQTQLHLIDFGFATTDLDSPLDKISGTTFNFPVDAEIYENYQENLATGVINKAVFNCKVREACKPNLSAKDYDRVATLRTIYNPIRYQTNYSILTHAYFCSLPYCVRSLFESKKMSTIFTEQRQNESEYFLAAILIAHLNKMKLNTPKIEEIRQDPRLQHDLIQQFQAEKNTRDDHFWLEERNKIKDFQMRHRKASTPNYDDASDSEWRDTTVDERDMPLPIKLPAVTSTPNFNNPESVTPFTDPEASSPVPNSQQDEERERRKIYTPK